MKSLKPAFLPALFALSALSFCQATTAGTIASSSSASFQATFVVLESCTIVSQRSNSNPSVRCQHNSPYMIERHAINDGMLSVVF